LRAPFIYLEWRACSAFFFGLPSVKHGHHIAHLPKAVRRLPPLLS
jgi:hypothetical protein